MQTLLLIVSMLLLVAGQILQKRGARHLVGSHHPREWVRALCSVDLLGAGACLIGGTLTWLLVLYSTDVSKAFPILSFGSILVLIAARLFLQEPVPAHRWAGAVLIVIGVALVSAS